jgi:hypothetical protein
MLSSLNTKCSFAGNGLTTDFTYTFQISTVDGSDIEVWLISPTNVESQVLASYSIDVSHATVTYPTPASLMPALPSLWTLELRRVEALTQPIDITAEVSAVDVASAAQEAVDRLGMAIQQVDSKASAGVPGPTGATGNIASAGGLTALPAKTTPADNDLLLLEDSADALKMKKTLWSSIKSTLKTYFDSLYQTILSLPLATGQGGTGSTANANAASGVVVLDSNSKLPAVNGSQLTNVSAGKVIQVVNYQTGAVASGSTVMSGADAIPQNTAGDEYMTLAITPTSATNKLKIEVDAVSSASAAGLVIMGLFQDSTAGALAASTMVGAQGNPLTGHISYYMTAGTISTTTFKVRIGNGYGPTTTFNGSGGSRVLGGVAGSSITITEIKA